MAETRLADVIVPEVFTEYTLEPSIHRNRFYKSGVIARNNDIDGILAGGGTLFNFPFWQNLSDTESGVPSETVATTVNNITTDKQIAVRMMREAAWGANAIAAIESGDDPLGAITARVTDYWATDYNKTAISILSGIVNDNVANDSSDLVNDISDSASPNLSDNAVTDTMALLGENAVLNRGDNSEFVAIGVHPDTYFNMQKLDLIDTYQPASAQARPLEFYRTMQVIVDKRFPKIDESGGYKYITYLFKSGSLQMGMSSRGYVPTEIDRDATKGGGIDNLYTRRVYNIHPVGFAYQKASQAGLYPTNNELAKGSNWDRVFEKENCGFVALIHELS